MFGVVGIGEEIPPKFQVNHSVDPYRRFPGHDVSQLPKIGSGHLFWAYLDWQRIQCRMLKTDLAPRLSHLVREIYFATANFTIKLKMYYQSTN